MLSEDIPRLTHSVSPLGQHRGSSPADKAPNSCSRSQLPSQHFCTTCSSYYSYVPKRISVATKLMQNCNQGFNTFQTSGKQFISPFQWNRQKLQEGRTPAQTLSLPSACAQGRGEVCATWSLSLKGAGFAPQPLSTFLGFFPFMLCRSGLEVTAESTGSQKSLFQPSVTWGYFCDKQKA